VDGLTAGSLGPDEAGEAVRHAQAELERAVREGNLTKDPMRFALGALAVTLGAQHQLHVDNVRQLRAVVADVEQQMSAAIEVARQPVDPTAIKRLETAAATGAARHAAELARAHRWRTIVIAAAVLVGGVVAGAAGGVLAERHSQIATEAGITAEAFSDGPAAAAAWLNLMRANDVVGTLATCTGKSVVVADGRRACGVAMWLDPPLNPAPRTAPTSR
jgi:hypothetical protein